MEIRQLEIFISVAGNLSFSRAAEEMYISQPTVSAYISSLEKSLGAQLFIRNTKEVALTKNGEKFLLHAKNILSMRDAAFHCINGNSKGKNGVIDIISSTIPAQHLLPEIIASFRVKWPNIVFRVAQSDSRHVEREMSSFRYDFGMVGALSDGSGLISHPIYEDKLVLVLPANMDIADETICAGFAEFIENTPFIMREEGSGTRAEIETLLSEIGVDAGTLHVPAYFPDANGILLAVSCGMGVSIISKIATVTSTRCGLIRVLEMEGPLFRRQIRLIYNKELCLSPVQRAFAEHIQGFYASKTV